MEDNQVIETIIPLLKDLSPVLADIVVKYVAVVGGIVAIVFKLITSYFEYKTTIKVEKFKIDYSWRKSVNGGKLKIIESIFSKVGTINAKFLSEKNSISLFQEIDSLTNDSPLGVYFEKREIDIIKKIQDALKKDISDKKFDPSAINKLLEELKRCIF